MNHLARQLAITPRLAHHMQMIRSTFLKRIKLRDNSINTVYIDKYFNLVGYITINDRL